jgi:sigma-E factor negative regulatory protein RseA
MNTADTDNLPLEQLSHQELLSALHDGQLDAAQATALVNASLQDDSLMLQWRSLSTISQVLRDQAAVPAIGVRPALAVTFAAAQSNLPSVARQEAANDGIFRWKMVAGIAAFSAVGSLVWGLMGAAGSPGLQTGTPLASTPSATLVSSQTAQTVGQEVTMIRNPRLDELLAAHKQFGGVSALQQPAGSLRSVSLNSNRP